MAWLQQSVPYTLQSGTAFILKACTLVTVYYLLRTTYLGKKPFSVGAMHGPTKITAAISIDSCKLANHL